MFVIREAKLVGPHGRLLDGFLAQNGPYKFTISAFRAKRNLDVVNIETVTQLFHDKPELFN